MFIYLLWAAVYFTVAFVVFGLAPVVIAHWGKGE